MKYFEILDPYYSLIKANTGEDAVMKYIEVVEGVESDFDALHEECRMVPEDYALVRFAQAPSEDNKLVGPHEILEDFKKAETSILIMDGSLI